MRHYSLDLRADQRLAGDSRANRGDQIRAGSGRADERARLGFNCSEQHRIGLRLRQRNQRCRPARASQANRCARYRAQIHSKVDDDDVRPPG